MTSNFLALLLFHSKHSCRTIDNSGVLIIIQINYHTMVVDWFSVLSIWISLLDTLMPAFNLVACGNPRSHRVSTHVRCQLYHFYTSSLLPFVFILLSHNFDLLFPIRETHTYWPPAFEKFQSVFFSTTVCL